jgi:hypothetical protein
MTRSSPFPTLLASIGGLAILGVAPSAVAEPSPPSETPVDVAVADRPPARRTISVEWNPLALFTIGKLSANVVIVPVDHHALVLSPFYAWTTTQPIFVFSDQGAATQLPTQKFSGFGGEIGYRYYTEARGPRGFFVGPSLIFGVMSAKAQDGNETDYLDLGVAVDVGYEAIIADSVVLSLGAGVQYTTPDKSIPSQQFPADIYANSKVFPRALASIGWVF